MLKRLLIFILGSTAAHAQLRPNGATASFRGGLPPMPVSAPSAEQVAGFEARLKTLTGEFQAVKKHERAADADIFLKAARYALEFHEWYDKKAADGVRKMTTLLDEAEKRITALRRNETPWMDGAGQKVLGFYSKIDDSPQPYGVEVPEGLDLKSKPVPLWIWLHGRGDTLTDLHFVYARLTAKKPGQFQPKDAIVIHPFGRYCNGWKSAGETDVFECRDDTMRRFSIDPDRVALAGFSMGGAGAWHLGAHYADQWACVHTGAGFADVRRYLKLTPETFPVGYEQKLWGVYDVPDYARNFFNVPLISYSGELDAQRDSAEYMMETLAHEGLHPPHLIGPGMGHKYHPEVLKKLQAMIENTVAKGRVRFPDEVHIQTRTPFYGRMKWLNLHGMEESWKDARLDAKITHGNTLEITTRNVSRIVLYPPPQVRKNDGKLKLQIDGQTLQLTVGPELPQFENFLRPGPRVPGSFCRLVKEGGKWRNFGNDTPFVHEGPEGGKVSAHPGPMDASFQKRFLVVLPDSASSNPAVDAWVKAESVHFLRRWRGLMRGDARVVSAAEVGDIFEAGKTQSLILWGTPESNRCIKALLATLPVQWDAKRAGMKGKNTFDAATHVPLLTYPCLRSAGFEAVINSGLTFREAHDRTNSLQNPKLPDWAILDISQAPNNESAGKVVDAGFFDDHWQVQ